jgi:peptide/nickel transport system permease protein
MVPFVARRLLAAVPVLFLVSLITFGLMHLVPGDTAIVMAGPDATREEIEFVRRQLGLDRPWYEQLGRWYVRLLQGDLGESVTLSRGVGTAIAERVPVTLGLAAYALALTLAIGVPMGVLAAVRHHTWLDGLCMVTALIGVSLPNFWLGIVLIFLFGVSLGWFPTGGYVPVTEAPLGWLRSMTLPAASLAVLQLGLIARITRSSMLEILGQDYIRTAHAVGLPPSRVVAKYALRNVLVPVLTVVGIAFSLMLAGTVVIETVYSLPGVGRLVVSAIARRDYPVVQGALLLVAVTCVVLNVLIDVLYAAVDPRVRYE